MLAHESPYKQANEQTSIHLFRPRIYIYLCILLSKGIQTWRDYTAIAMLSDSLLQQHNVK
jgi:hypothetical protein